MAQLGQKKSRRGCNRCKQRRVKCDEEAPCGNCIRRCEECSLLEPSPSSSQTRRDPGVPATTEEWLSDMELMNHYGTSAAAATTLALSPEARQVWREYIPEQALKHPFLMHGILAFSALHLAYLRQWDSPRHLQLCDKHQAIALNKFRSVLSSDINADLADALFALAMTISVSSMARACALAEAAGQSKAMTINDVSELFHLTRGVGDIIAVTHGHVRNGPLGQLFNTYRMPEGTEVMLPSAVQDQFSALRQMLATWGLDSEALSHCQSALTDLEEIYCNIKYWAANGGVYAGQLIRWFTMVTTGFVKLVQARNQPALVIIAYYAAATTSVPSVWYLRNWGMYALSGLRLELEQSMLHWLNWPSRQLQERLSVLGVSLTQEDATLVQPLFGHS